MILVTDLFLALSLHGLPLVPVHGERDLVPLPLPLPHHGTCTVVISSKPNHFPKAPSPNAITLEVRISTYEFRGDQTQHSFYTKAGRSHSTLSGVLTEVCVCVVTVRSRKTVIDLVEKLVA